MKKIIDNKLGVLTIAGCLLFMSGLTSCSKFFDVDSDYVINADDDHLGNATDTIYSVTGIINKMQAIADRTILLGELRGDLVTVSNDAPADLQELASFTISDENVYNNPRDYYAIINNCNYFINRVDTAQKNNRNEHLFKKEYAAVKAFRAWTYLQLAINYGSVPFFTEPILTINDANISKYPKKDIQAICEYFLDEDGLKLMANPQDYPYPNYERIKDGNMDSRLYFMPMNIILGDLSLWAGRYLDAAKYYYDYISTRNGRNSVYPTTLRREAWADKDYSTVFSTNRWADYFTKSQEVVSNDAELIMMIPSDSIPAEGYYSGLCDIFNSTTDNGGNARATYSAKLKEISKSQKYCYYVNEEIDPKYPGEMRYELNTGDLRLSATINVIEDMVNPSNNQRYNYQRNYKYYGKYMNSDGSSIWDVSQTQNIHIYRRTMVYLRMAEAFNRAGYPKLAFDILSTGLTNTVIKKTMEDYYSADASKICEYFDFPEYGVNPYKSWDGTAASEDDKANTMGIHNHGSGYTPKNMYFTMPVGTLEEQIEAVEDLIMTEEALEFAFEGYRYQDLLRIALRRNDSNYIYNALNQRNGTSDSGVKVDLHDKKNWFLSWKGQIGYGL